MKRTYKTDLRELNNTARKGLYVYIKEKGKHSRYYKTDGTKQDIDDIIRAFENKYILESTERSVKAEKDVISTMSKDMRKQKRALDEYVLKAKSDGNISTQLNKGRQSIHIPDLAKTSNKTLKDIKRQLMEPLMKDKKNIEKIIKEENQRKIKLRMNHVIELRDNSNQTILVMKKYKDNKELNKWDNDIEFNALGIIRNYIPIEKIGYY